LRIWLCAALLCLCLCLLPCAASGGSADLPVLYQGTASQSLAIRATPSKDADSVGFYNVGDTVDVLAVEPQWLTVRKGAAVGYVLRHIVSIDKQIDPEAPAYGAMFPEYAATLAADAPVMAAPYDGAQVLVNLPEGGRVCVFSLRDGWAEVMVNRQYGYLYGAHIASLEPVIADEDAAGPGDLIAAYSTVYPQTDTELNRGRMINIARASELMDGQVVQAGVKLSFNSWIGPFSLSRGFATAPVLVDGQTIPGSGGGTCQVSTTLYNVILQLPGIDVLYRRPHGPSGAAYVPHGVDAAVGNETLDLRFMNAYGYTLVIDAFADRGLLYIGILKGE